MFVGCDLDFSGEKMEDKNFKTKYCKGPCVPEKYSICKNLPCYNPDICCCYDDNYLIYESESSSNRKAHVGAFLEACYAMKQKGASSFQMFFIQKEAPNITVDNLVNYFQPYVRMMSEKMSPLRIEVYFISDINFEKIMEDANSILDVLGQFVKVSKVQNDDQ